MNSKTRNLSVSEYFAVIQREYILADFRRKIYYNPKDKKYYKKVMDYKRQKIESIAERNNLLSIFSNEEKYKEVRAELFDEFGKPKFELTETDVKNYYSKGNDFQYNGNVWTLDEICDNGEMIIYSKKLERFEKVSREKICRII